MSVGIIVEINLRQFCLFIVNACLTNVQTVNIKETEENMYHLGRFGLSRVAALASGIGVKSSECELNASFDGLASAVAFCVAVLVTSPGAA